MKKTKKLKLDRQTIARLDDRRLRNVFGGTEDTGQAPTDSCVETGCCGGGYLSRPPWVCAADIPGTLAMC